MQISSLTFFKRIIGWPVDNQKPVNTVKMEMDENKKKMKKEQGKKLWEITILEILHLTFITNNNQIHDKQMERSNSSIANLFNNSDKYKGTVISETRRQVF